MGKPKSLSKAVHFVSDLTTVFLNPISDKAFKDNLVSPHFDAEECKRSHLDSVNEEGSGHFVDEPDTSSFAAFLYSLLTSSESGNDEQSEDRQSKEELQSDGSVRETSSKKGLLSRGKQSVKTMLNATRFFGVRSQERKSEFDKNVLKSDAVGLEMNHLRVDNKKSDSSSGDLSGLSEPSMLLSDKSRSSLYAYLPVIVQGRRWLLLYSTWKHGTSLSTLYRKSILWPGLSILVVGDRKGAVFGGLVEAPLKPSDKKYQGTNNTFVFTNMPGYPVVYQPTGANRYYTLCSPEFLAIGGGGHFALYLDSDLLNGSSAASETYGNPCLAFSNDFEVKGVELWGFVYGSKYDEILALSRTEVPGICNFGDN